MDSVPISKFEHRVARWASRLRKEGRALRVTQRGETSVIVLPEQVYEELQKDKAEKEALQIKALIEAGDRAFREGRFVTHEEVGRRLGLLPARKRRRK